MSNNDDCNDSTSAARPGATETCDGIDNDCDNSIDETNASGCTTYYRDFDGDGYGSSSNSQCLCSPSGYYDVTNGSDCYDSNGDGRLNVTEREELIEGVNKDIAARYERHDKDGDGKLSNEEIASMAEELAAEWGVKPQGK